MDRVFLEKICHDIDDAASHLIYESDQKTALYILGAVFESLNKYRSIMDEEDKKISGYEPVAGYRSQT